MTGPSAADSEGTGLAGNANEKSLSGPVKMYHGAGVARLVDELCCCAVVRQPREAATRKIWSNIEILLHARYALDFMLIGYSRICFRFMLGIECQHPQSFFDSFL